MIRTFGAWRCIRSYHDCHSPLPMNKLRLFPLANAHYITISLGWMPVIFDFFFKKLLKVYLPTPFCKFFSQKWNIPSLIASFRGHLDGTFAEKFIFLLITRGDLKNVRWFFFNQKRSTDLHIPAKSHGTTSPGKHIPHRLVIRLE